MSQMPGLDDVGEVFRLLPHLSRLEVHQLWVNPGPDHLDQQTEEPRCFGYATGHHPLIPASSGTSNPIPSPPQLPGSPFL
jgi:hypothetical protein